MDASVAELSQLILAIASLVGTTGTVIVSLKAKNEAKEAKTRIKEVSTKVDSSAAVSEANQVKLQDVHKQTTALTKRLTKYDADGR